MYFGGSDKHTDSLRVWQSQEPQSWRWLWVFSFLWVGLESRREDSCVCFVKNVFDFSTFRGCFYWVSNCRFWSSLPRCWKGPFHPLWGTATQGAYLTAPLKLVCLSPQFTFGCLLVRLSAVFLFGRAIPRLDLNEICRILGHHLFIDSFSWNFDCM